MHRSNGIVSGVGPSSIIKREDELAAAFVAAPPAAAPAPAPAPAPSSGGKKGSSAALAGGDPRGSKFGEWVTERGPALAKPSGAAWPFSSPLPGVQFQVWECATPLDRSRPLRAAAPVAASAQRVW